MTHPQRQWLALLGIEPSETKTVTLLMALYFCLGVAIVLTQTVAFALFLSANGPQALPYAYLITAVGAALAAFVYLRLGERLSFPNLLSANLLFLIVASVLFRAGLAQTGPLAVLTVFALPLWFQVVTNLGNLVFWALAGSLFTVRQGKRLFGLVSTGSWVATILGGFIASPLIAWMGMPNLLMIAALSLVGALMVLRVILRTCLPPRPKPPRRELPRMKSPASAPSTAKPLPSLLRSRYVRLIFAFLFIWWLGFNIIQSIFSDRAAQQYANVDQLGAFLGNVAGVSGVLALIMNALFTAPVIQRYGLWGGLLIMPLAVTAVVAGLAISGTLGASAMALFVLATLAKLLNVGLGFGLDQPAHSILYKPLPGHQIGRVPIIAEGIVQPLSVGCAGVILLIFGALPSLASNPAIGMSYLFVLVGLVWVALTIVLIGVYRGALSDALAARRLGDLARAMLDQSSIALLTRYLRDPYPGAVIYALQSLEQLEHPLAPAVLSPLLAHPVMNVRREAMAYIERKGARPKPAPMAEAIKAQLADEPSAEVREAGLRALAVVTSDVVADLSPALASSNRADQRGALIGLLRHGGIDGVMLAGQTYNALLASPHSVDRAVAAQVLGEVGVTHFYQPLLPLLNDAALEVRRAALLAAGHIKHPALWPTVIEACDAPETQHHAMQALVLGADAALPYIEQALSNVVDADDDDDDDVDGVLNFAASEPVKRSGGGDWRRVCIQVCGRLRGERVLALLVRLLQRAYAPSRPLPMALRTQVLSSLHQQGYHADRAEVRQLLRAAGQRELAQAATITTALVDLRHAWEGKPPAAALLIAALETELRQTRNRLLWLLSFLYDSGAITKARQTLMGMDYGAVDPAQLAYAIELVDTQLPAEDKATVLALLEPLPLAERLARLGKLFPPTHRTAEEWVSLMGDQVDGGAVGETSAVFSHWTQACALYGMGELRLGNHEVVLRRCQDDTPLIRKTALWAWSRLKASAPTAAHTGQDIPTEVNPEMLSTIEKVIILKTVNVFAQTPDAVLAEVADLLEEIALETDTIVFRKGDVGDSLYLIVQGRVQVEEGDKVLRQMGAREVFGEMALLDNEPRSASVRTIEPVQLLRLSQSTFYELLADRPEIATGIIRVLMGYIRSLNQRLAEERA